MYCKAFFIVKMFCCFRKSSTEIQNPMVWEDTIPFVPKITSGTVIKVYDGDTITIATTLAHDSTMYRFSVRLAGIDGPELKTNNENEKKHAIIARDALSEKIMGKVVTCKNVSLEKYGRVLADIYYEGLHLNEWMKTNHCVEYHGKTKEKPKEWFQSI